MEESTSTSTSSVQVQHNSEGAKQVMQQQVAQVPAQPQVAQQLVQKKPAQRKKAAKKTKTVLVKSKRKEAVARASLKAGTGKLTINNFSIDTIEPKELKYAMMEPLLVSKLASSLSKKIDIKVTVRGGGISARAQAVRGAIAKGISKYADSDVIRKELMHYNRSMLVDDPRRVEPKKFKGPKARARFQTSYR
jgi:ribosomal protein S9